MTDSAAPHRVVSFHPDKPTVSVTTESFMGHDMPNWLNLSGKQFNPFLYGIYSA